MRIKGVLEPGHFESAKEEQEHALATGSSFLSAHLNNEEVEELNRYIAEKERIVELHLTAQTVNYRDCLVDSYRGVEDPFESEIAELGYNQNPAEPSQVIREIAFKRNGTETGASLGN